MADTAASDHVELVAEAERRAAAIEAQFAETRAEQLQQVTVLEAALDDVGRTAATADARAQAAVVKAERGEKAAAAVRLSLGGERDAALEQAAEAPRVLGREIARLQQQHEAERVAEEAAEQPAARCHRPRLVRSQAGGGGGAMAEPGLRKAPTCVCIVALYAWCVDGAFGVWQW
ncbi:unnamed protein product [Prorocentrum cordatum]|uniref:Uncharacterized protein n=1 Tax=Prorocentrum cordatum TaxID=2364126 RepID=A0ABN9QMF0_9DINO|nr:unnamed protein product [Polarella glacialis]